MIHSIWRWLAVVGTLTILAGLCLAAAPENPAPPDAASFKTSLLAEYGQTRIKTRNKPRILRYEDVDARLVAILSWAESIKPAWEPVQEAEAGDAIIHFDEIFIPAKTPCFMPLTNNIVKHVPETSLKELAVHEPSGDVLGTFAGKYEFTRTGIRTYTLHCFQYERPDGRMQRSGTDLLLDRFLVPWAAIAERPFLIFRPTQ
jgi:hypothetical protein